jgi:hypothetical protein
VGGARPPPSTTFTITRKVAVYASAEWADTLTLLHVSSLVKICTLWFYIFINHAVHKVLLYFFVNHAVQEHGQCIRTCLYTRVAGSYYKQIKQLVDGI